MATYAQLEAEPWWGQETEAPALAAFNNRLRTHYGHTRAQTGSKGDNRHLRGRHRSRDWVLFSRYCTDRAYATRDARDKRGNGRWLRATDCGIQGPQLWAASKRLDAAVRAGRLPCIAEWFGSIDGLNVIGWHEGRPSTSDISHTWHLHVGVWTEYADDAAQLDLLADIITGKDDDMPYTEAEMKALPWQYNGRGMRGVPEGRTTLWVVGELYAGQRDLAASVTALRAVVEQLAAAIKAGGGTVDTAAILAGVDDRLAALREQVRGDVDTELDEQSRAGADAD